MVTNKKQLLGENSYSEIVKQIYFKIQKAQADTLEGNELLKETYAKLNESKTPILSLKPFVTGAEKIASDDAKLADILKFVKKSIVGNADLNFLINLVKEEHFANLTRAGHPSPESTVKDFEDQFGKPSSVIEEGIKAGIFDSMKSSLLQDIKKNITKPKTEDKKLNESDAQFSGIFGNIAKYSPIGIKLEDIKNDRLIMLTESAVFQVNRKNNELSSIESNSVEIPVEYKRLLESINSCGYSPIDNTFTLNENWDFQLKLNPDGNVTINNKNIPTEKVRDLLLESVRVYATDPVKYPNFNKLNYLHDADNFIMLMENHSQLIRLDNLQVLKNLNENSYVIYDKNIKTPKVLYSKNSIGNESFNQLFESFQELVINSNNILNFNINPLFESFISTELEIINARNNKIQSLMEEQKDLNVQIQKVNALKSIADEDSPAMDKLNEQHKLLNTKLDENLKNLNESKNNFILYK